MPIRQSHSVLSQPLACSLSWRPQASYRWRDRSTAGPSISGRRREIPQRCRRAVLGIILPSRWSNQNTVASKQRSWTRPAAMAIPKGEFFKDKVEQGRYGPKVIPGRTLLPVCEEHRRGRRGPARLSRCAQAALPALGALPDQRGHDFSQNASMLWLFNSCAGSSRLGLCVKPCHARQNGSACEVRECEIQSEAAVRTSPPPALATPATTACYAGWRATTHRRRRRQAAPRLRHYRARHCRACVRSRGPTCRADMPRAR